MLDRLEKLGYLTRSPHPSDRRKLIVRATQTATQRAWELIGRWSPKASSSCSPATAPSNST
jgi:DNA-binding MarR family transcriptional regulator